MITAFTTSLSGMRSTQTMLDVTANNLSNAETPGFKAGRAMFADQMNLLERAATAPTGPVGGRNPEQIGNGSQIASVQKLFTQGSAELTGRSLDLMINGDGFFQLQGLDGGVTYSRVGAFAFDGGYQGVPRLVDLVSGGLVLNTQGQPITQVDRVAANATTRLDLTGNLPPQEARPLHGTSLDSLFPLRLVDGTPAVTSTRLQDTSLRQGPAAATTLQVFGTTPDGLPYQGTVALAADATVGDLVTGLNQALTRTVPVVDGAGNPVLDGSGAPLTRSEALAQISLSGGSLRATAAVDGSDFSLFLGEQALPATRTDAAATTWQYGAAGDTYAWSRLRMVPSSVATELPLFTGDGTRHVLNGRWFSAGTVTEGTGAATDFQRVWDLVVDEPAGAADSLTPGADRLRGLTFAADGSLLTAPTGSIGSTWATGGAATVALDATRFTGYQGEGVADATDETGYPAGLLQGVSVTANGEVQGIYSNGRTATMSTTDHQIGLVTFANPSGLLALDQNRFSASINSGAAVQVAPGTAGTNTITAGALEGSNVDLSIEFTRLIISQRGFQSNSKAFQTADAILQEATGLIR